MSQCKEFQKMFYEYIDGTLSKADEVRLTEHLETCRECREELAFVKSISQELRNQPMAPLPENFTSTLREQLVKANMDKPVKKKKGFLSYLPRYGFAVSAVAAFAIMIIAYQNNLQPLEYPSGADNNLLQTITSSPTPVQTENSEQVPIEPQDVESIPEIPQKDEAQQQDNPSDKSGSAKRPLQTARPSINRPGTQSQSNSGATTTLPPQTPASTQPPSGETTSSSGGSGGGSSAENNLAGEKGAPYSASNEDNSNSVVRSNQNLIFVIHSTLDSETLQNLYALPSFQVVGGNRYQMQRAYQNELIKALKNVDYSIQFASETSRVDIDAIIIELF